MSATTGGGWPKTSWKRVRSVSEVETIVEAIVSAQGPLTVLELAKLTGLDNRVVDGVLWGSPDRFVWQPGHRWGVAPKKQPPRVTIVPASADARAASLSGESSTELRAVTLASGLVIHVSRLPLDSDAFFSVRSAGNTVQLVINSTHELFARLPMPFEEDSQEFSYKTLVEVLLQGWALYEDGVSGRQARRAMEDVRLLWGRRAVEVLRDSE